MLRSMEFFYSRNSNSRAARTLDLGTHGIQEFCQITNFWLTRGAFDERPPRSQYGGHQQVGCAQHRGTRAASKKNFCSLESLGCGTNITSCGFYLGAKCLHAF